jgi:hypothetical protein
MPAVMMPPFPHKTIHIHHELSANRHCIPRFIFLTNPFRKQIIHYTHEGVARIFGKSEYDTKTMVVTEVVG